MTLENRKGPSKEEKDRAWEVHVRWNRVKFEEGGIEGLTKALAEVGLIDPNAGTVELVLKISPELPPKVRALQIGWATEGALLDSGAAGVKAKRIVVEEGDDFGFGHRPIS